VYGGCGTHPWTDRPPTVDLGVIQPGLPESRQDYSLIDGEGARPS
jgi:hypothetical protein